MVSTKDIFSRELIKKIRISNYSQIPIYKGNDKNKIVSLLKTKYILLTKEKHLNKPIAKRFPNQQPLFVASDTSMLEMLMIFSEKKSNFAFITDEVVKPIPVHTENTSSHHVEPGQNLLNFNVTMRLPNRICSLCADRNCKHQAGLLKKEKMNPATAPALSLLSLF